MFSTTGTFLFPTGKTCFSCSLTFNALLECMPAVVTGIPGNALFFLNKRRKRETWLSRCGYRTWRTATPLWCLALLLASAVSVRARSSSSVTENKLRILQKQKDTHTYTGIIIHHNTPSNTSSEKEVDTLQPEAWTRCHKQPHLPFVSNVCSRSGKSHAARQKGYSEATKKHESNYTETQTQTKESQRHESTAKNTKSWKSRTSVCAETQECEVELSSGVCPDPQPGRGSSSQMVQTFSPNQIFSPPPVSQRLSPVIWLL